MAKYIHVNVCNIEDALNQMRLWAQQDRRTNVMVYPSDRKSHQQRWVWNIELVMEALKVKMF